MTSPSSRASACRRKLKRKKRPLHSCYGKLAPCVRRKWRSAVEAIAHAKANGHRSDRARRLNGADAVPLPRHAHQATMTRETSLSATRRREPPEAHIRFDYPSIGGRCQICDSASPKRQAAAAAAAAAAMPHYKLVYFKSRGRAEVARYLFALAKVHFVDVQVDREEWPKIKPGTPYGILPVLDVDGVQYCQSNAINRFLAREFGFYGSTSAEAFRIDMVADCLSDALSDLVTCLWVLQGEAKEKAKEQLANETLPKLTKFVEHELGSKQWIVGHKVSVADLGVVEFFDNAVPKMFPGDQWKCLSEKILALVGRVKAIPEIAAYVAKRAATE